MAVTDYLRGAGTSADPYIIHNVAAWIQFFTVDKARGLYFEVISDIDCGGITLTHVQYFYGSLNGNGYKIYGFSASATNSSFCGNNSTPGELKNIHISMMYTGSAAALSCSSSSRVNWVDVRFDIVLTYSTAEVFTILAATTGSTISNLIITYYGSNNFCSNTSSYNYDGIIYVIAPNATMNLTGTGVVSLASSESLLPSSYPTLGSDWVMNGISIPYLYSNGRTDLIIKYAVKGITRVGGNGKSRNISVFTAAYIGVLKKLKSNTDGSYLIDMADVYDPVYVMHYDDYGFPLFANSAYGIGTYIHPKTPNGYRYKCTTAGTSAGTLPTDPWPTSSNLISGTAIFSPEPVYAAETFLVSPHLYDFLTGQPV